MTMRWWSALIFTGGALCSAVVIDLSCGPWWAFVAAMLPWLPAGVLSDRALKRLPPDVVRKCAACSEVATIHGYCGSCWDLLTGSGLL